MESLERSRGLIGLLRSRETPFNRQIVVSKSSRDLVQFVDPDSSDWYGSFSSGEAWLEFRFASPIEINGVRLRRCALSPPSSFDVVDADSEATLQSVTDADFESHGGECVVRFPPICTSALKIRQTGPNREGQQYLNIGKIEFTSPDRAYSSGVFRTIFNAHRADVRRYIEVGARDGDRGRGQLHLITPRTRTWTFKGKQSWVQVEVVGGQFVVGQYRLNRHTGERMRSWTLRGSSSSAVPFSEWTVLDRREEPVSGAFGDLAAFDAGGGPFRCFRLVQEGPTWNGKTRLSIYHLEFFGCFIPDQ
jgi:hypothetical protein